MIVYGRLWFSDVPIWRIILTILGVDEWLSMHGIRTFSSGVGEWFLGEIVILYLLFPVLRWSMRKNPKLFFLLCLAVYVLTVFLFKREIPHFSANLILKGFEFIVGMYIGKYYKVFPNKLLFISFPIVFFFVLDHKIELPINKAIMITVFTLSFFITVSFLEGCLRKHPIPILHFTSDLSYELFLTHHIVIYYLTPRMAPYISGLRVIILVLFELIVTILLALLIRSLSKWIVEGIRKIKCIGCNL